MSVYSARMMISPHGLATTDECHTRVGNIGQAQQWIAPVLADDFKASTQRCRELGIAWTLNLGSERLTSSMPVMDVLEDKAYLYKVLARVRSRLTVDAADVVL